MKTNTPSKSDSVPVPAAAIRTEGLVLAGRGQPAAYTIVVPRYAS